MLHFDKLRQARTGFRFNLYEERRELFLASDADAPAASQADFRKLRLSRISVKTRESRSSGRTNRHVPRSPSHERKQRRIVSAFWGTACVSGAPATGGHGADYFNVLQVSRQSLPAQITMEKRVN